jgi:nucleotide-binding universal stress UspA family protein
MYKAIMVPIDLTQAEKGKATIDVAKKLSEEGNRIMLINVTEHIPDYVAAEILGDIIEAAGVKADVEVRPGPPAATILAAAEEKGTDLIIIASHQPGLKDYLLGSTASRVVRHATCSVLVVR